MESSDNSFDVSVNFAKSGRSSGVVEDSQSIISDSEPNISSVLCSTKIYDSNKIETHDESKNNTFNSSGSSSHQDDVDESEVLDDTSASPDRSIQRSSKESSEKAEESENTDASSFIVERRKSKKTKKPMVIDSDDSEEENEKEKSRSRRSSRRSVRNSVENFTTPMKTNSINLLENAAFSEHRSHKKKPIINSDSETDEDENDGIIDDLTYADESDDIVIIETSNNPIVLDSDSDDIHNALTPIKSNKGNASDIVDSDSDQENIQPSNIVERQQTLREMFIKSEKVVESPKTATTEGATGFEVTEEVYDTQKTKVSRLQMELQKAKNLQRTLNIALLPDKGKLLIARHENLLKTLASEEEKLKKMVVKKGSKKPLDSLSMATGPKPSSWQNLEKISSAVQPRTFGKKALETLHVQKSLTMDRLHQLHGSLKTCPTEDTVAEDPKGIKVDLMPHQRRALAWLLWREQQKPSGGILADDMGLGKTLTMLSLMVKSIQMSEDEESSDEEEPRNQKRKGGTLIVCPASLIGQWKSEVERRFKAGLVSVEIYHGTKRETNSKRLAEYDMVITTYSIVMTEDGKNTGVSRLKWKRIILDEAHQIRNHKAKTAVSVCKLSAYSRWALTGTPIHNKELDIYSLLKFLRVSPFDDLPVFKRWVSDKNSGGQERLNTVMSSIMLRRTKAQLQELGSLNCLPDRKWELIEIHLQKHEMDVYQKVLMFSRTLFAQYLHQRAEKQQDSRTPYDTPLDTMSANGPNQEYYKMHKKLVKMNRVKEVKQHEILLLLLRLRQICCHPSLITAMLEGEDIGQDCDSEDEAVNILDQLNKLNIHEEDDEHHSMEAEEAKEGVGLAEATRGILNPNNPIFDIQRRSTKVNALIDILKEKVVPNNDKAIIVSQWTGLLRLVTVHLKEEGFFFDQLDGTVPVHKRAAMVDKFNDPNSKINILLLSLTAGGVGLNLVGANHLLLLDLHWNPQLEMQAQDRIYRVGQKKPVYVYKFMSVDTIEERIKALQDHKKNIAEGMLTGARITQTKLSLDDLKMLFSM